MTLVKVELIGGPSDGRIIEVRDDMATTITVATPCGVTVTAPNDGDLTPPYISTGLPVQRQHHRQRNPPLRYLERTQPVTIGPGYTDPNPNGYEAPNGVEATIPGAPDDAGSRDPSSTTVAGAVANAYAQMREIESDTNGQGSNVGDQIDLPDPQSAL